MCCTNEDYLKPLTKGIWCLNWGKALGKECTTNNECKSFKRPQASCVDGECCTRPREVIEEEKEEGESDLILKESSEESEENEKEKKKNKSKEEDEMGNEEDKYEEDFEDFKSLESGEDLEEDFDRDSNDDIDVNNQNKFMTKELSEGRRICRSKGLLYKKVRRCSPNLTCGNKYIFLCISGHCCLKKEENYEEDLNEGRIPFAPFGFCLLTRKYRRFIGRLCNKISDCPKAFDVNRKRVPIRCLRGLN
ncbi:unnamed protein product [Meloidogyne enterolobii]|uniref:Uncharacterized protein n=2 Tax=Meloidogyne enterolobii TaxID=390850 RepID=A0ACB0Z1K1_MELEN